MPATNAYYRVEVNGRYSTIHATRASAIAKARREAKLHPNARVIVTRVLKSGMAMLVNWRA